VDQLHTHSACFDKLSMRLGFFGHLPKRKPHPELVEGWDGRVTDGRGQRRRLPAADPVRKRRSAEGPNPALRPFRDRLCL